MLCHAISPCVFSVVLSSWSSKDTQSEALLAAARVDHAHAHAALPALLRIASASNVVCARTVPDRSLSSKIRSCCCQFQSFFPNLSFFCLLDTCYKSMGMLHGRYAFEGNRGLGYLATPPLWLSHRTPCPSMPMPPSDALKESGLPSTKPGRPHSWASIFVRRIFFITTARRRLI